MKPPTVDVLLGKFREATLLYGHDKVYISDKRPPDAKWLVAVVGTLLPDDEIFAKGYVPPPRRARQADAKVIEIPIEMLVGVPDSKSKAKARRLRVMGECFVDARIDALKRVQKDIADQLLLQQLRKQDMLKHRDEVTSRRQVPFSEEEKKQVEERRTATRHDFLRAGAGRLASYHRPSSGAGERNEEDDEMNGVVTVHVSMQPLSTSQLQPQAEGEARNGKQSME